MIASGSTRARVLGALRKAPARFSYPSAKALGGLLSAAKVKAFSSSCANPAARPGGRRPVVLTILDGWGYRETPADNAVLLGDTPNFDALYGRHSTRGQVAFLDACEKDVGLPVGQIGNSEVGHMNIGAGRVVWQDICAIDNAIEDGSLQDQDALVDHIAALKESGGTSHVLGLVSPGGVHAMQSHIAAVCNIIQAAGVPVVVHAFTDGRDVPPRDAQSTFPDFLKSLDDGIVVGSVTGRYWAMDRDNRWERVLSAYDVIVSGKGVAGDVEHPMEAITQAYDLGENDEFVSPTRIGGYTGLREGDGLFMANFRSDRAREIMTALADPRATGEEHDGEYPELVSEIEKRKVENSEDDDSGSGYTPVPPLASVAGMVQYSDRHNEFMTATFPPKDIRNSLGEVVANAGMRQLRAAETEKYPHVTFFLNGGREAPFEGEDRILVPSPKVATYDLKPEMSAPEVGEKVCSALDSGEYDLAVVNFANPDMVGHTGDLNAAIAAVESVDRCLGDISRVVEKHNGALVVTADHGNCEKMYEEETEQPHTAHTLNKVPVILADFAELHKERASRTRGDERVLPATRIRSGRLADLAPTVLRLLGLEQPEEMTGQPLQIDEVQFRKAVAKKQIGNGSGALQDGPILTRPPMEGNPDAGSAAW